MIESVEFAAGFTGGIEGPCCDPDGTLLVTPDGVATEEVRLRTGVNCTNLAFGGPDGGTVYVPGRAFVLWSALRSERTP